MKFGSVSSEPDWPRPLAAVRVAHSAVADSSEEPTLAEGTVIATHAARWFAASPQGNAVGRRRRAFLYAKFVLSLPLGFLGFPWSLGQLHYNDRWWDYGKVLRECNNSIVGQLLFGDHVGVTQHGLCRHQDEAAQQEETLHLSLRLAGRLPVKRCLSHLSGLLLPLLSMVCRRSFFLLPRFCLLDTQLSFFFLFFF